MSFVLIVLIISVLLARLYWLRFFKGSHKIGFLLPLLLECLFVYPYIIIFILDLPWSLLGFLSFYLITLSVQLGMLANKFASEDVVCMNTSYNLYKLCVLLIFFVFIGVMSNHFNNLVSMSNPLDILKIANENAVARYSGALQVSFIYKIATIFSFLTSLILGLGCALNDKRKYKRLAAIFFALLFLDSLLMAARAGFLLQLFAFLSSFVVVKYVTSDQYFKIKKAAVRKVLLGIITLYSFFLIVQISRGGKTDFDLQSVASHILTWFVGHISVFDLWISKYYSFELTYGSRTFVGLYDALGLIKRAGGVYSPLEISAGRESNIYTAYRGLIEDFTFPIAMLSLFFLGFILHKSLLNLIRTKNRLSLFFSIVICYFFFWSFVINPFIYNSIIAAFFIFFFILFFGVKFERS